MTTPLIERLMARTRDDAGCAVWVGCASSGHPYARIDRKAVPVRRVIYQETFGTLKPDQIIRMTCGTPNCICVDHMQRTTRQRLASEMGEMGLMSGHTRSAAIAKACRANGKLNPAAVLDIKTSKESRKVLSERYGVSIQTIIAVQNGLMWHDFSTPWAQLVSTKQPKSKPKNPDKQGKTTRTAKILR